MSHFTRSFVYNPSLGDDHFDLDQYLNNLATSLGTSVVLWITVQVKRTLMVAF